MEKSKTEQYLVRLQKWKEQKRKEKEEKLKNNTRSCVSKPYATTAVKPVMKAGMKSGKSCVTGEGNTVNSKMNRIKTVSVAASSSSTKPMPGVSSKPAVKIERKRKSAETRELLKKLDKWREEKKSEKKRCERSVMKSREGIKVADRFRYKEVKSRLFDYQSKPKTNVTQRDKENVNVNSCQNTVAVSKKAAKRIDSTKSTMKRRHSEIQKSRTYSKPVGILKRKSCFGSFYLNDEESVKSFVKKRRTSLSTTDWTVKEGSLANDADRQDETGTSNLDVSTPKLPTAVVKPGLSLRNVRFTTPPNGHTESEGRKLRKTPKTHSARSKELSDWLKAKGRTPSKFRHLMCFHGEPTVDTSKDPQTKNMLSVDELSEQMDVLEQERLQAEAEERMHAMLDECMILFEAGCPLDSIVPWLNDIYRRIPCSQTSARFYTCKANVIKYSLDLDAVLEIFEQATIKNAQPKEEIAKCLTETLKYVTEEKVKQAKIKCHTPCRKEVQKENVFESTAIIYTVSNVTPFQKRKRSYSKMVSGPAQYQVVTPVRRSTRRSLQNLPESLKDKKKCFPSLSDVKGEDILFQPNQALDPDFATGEDL